MRLYDKVSGALIVQNSPSPTVASPTMRLLQFLNPGEIDIRRGGAEVTGRLCVIGAELKEEAVAALFGA